MRFPITRRAAALALLTLLVATSPAQAQRTVTVTTPFTTVAAGTTFTATFNFVNTGPEINITTIDVQSFFDNTRFQIIANSSTLSATLLNNGYSPADASFNEGVSAPNRYSASLSANVNSNGPLVASGSTTALFTVQFRALTNPAADPGAGFLDNIVPRIGSSITAFTDPNGTNIVLNPAPTNGFDAGRDVQVLISPVPEPASILAVCGLAGVWVARRRRAV